jgi:hypothetical protein
VTFLFKTEDKTVDSVETLVSVYQTKGFIAGLHPLSPCHFAWQLPERFSRTWRSSCLSYVITTATSADQYWHLHRSDCRNTLIHAHTTSRSLPTCNISLGWLTLPAPETGKLYVINPAIHPRQLWRYYSMWWEPQMSYSEVTVLTLNRLVWLFRCTLVYEKFPVRIWSGTPFILTENFHAFSHSRQANFLIVPRLDNVLSHQIPFHLISLSFYHVCSLSFWEYW